MLFKWVSKVVEYFKPANPSLSMIADEETEMTDIFVDNYDIQLACDTSNNLIEEEIEEEVEIVIEEGVKQTEQIIGDPVTAWQVVSGLGALVLSQENIPRISVAAVLTSLSTASNFLAPYLFGETVKLLMSEDEIAEISGIEFTRATLISMLVSAYTVTQLLPMIRDQILVPVTENNISNVIVNATEHLLKKSLSYHVTTPLPDMIYFIQKGFSLSTISTPLLTKIAPTTLEIAIACGVLSSRYGFWMGIGIIALLASYTGYGVLTTKPIIDLCEVRLKIGNEAWTTFDSAIARYKTIHDFGKLEETIKQVSLAMANAVKANIEATIMPINVGYGHIALSRCTMLLAALYVGLNVQPGKFSVEEFMVLVAYLNQLSTLLPGFGAAINSLFVAYPDLKFVFGELQKPDEIIDLHPDVPLVLANGEAPSIEFENVSFSYPAKPGQKSKLLLDNLSFNINSGEKVAFVSESGAGKTTIFNLLYGYYKPSSGCIKINGQDISELSLNSVQAQIGLLGQNPNLFKGTIRDNIRFGAKHPEEVTDEMIWELARLTNLDDFLLSLNDPANGNVQEKKSQEKNAADNALDTDVGDNGKTLSGGQQQKVAILRGLLKDSKIRLLDEITAPFDSKSATQVLKSITQTCTGKTTLMITHKLTEAQYVDKIIVIDKGRVVDVGTHSDLLRTCALYQKLWSAYTSQHSDINTTSSPSTERIINSLGGFSCGENELIENDDSSYAFNLFDKKRTIDGDSVRISQHRALKN